jgi:hypothetical protein
MDQSVIPAPPYPTVETRERPILYDAYGCPMYRKAGYR